MTRARSFRPPAWMPWGIVGLTLAAIAPAYVLLNLNEGTEAILEQVLFGGIFLGYGVIGAVVASRRPENVMGWILLGVSSITGLGFFSEQYGAYGTTTNPGSLPAAELVSWPGVWLWFPGVGLILVGLLLFPTGSLPSPRWRPVGWLTGALIVVTTLTFAFMPSSPEDAVRNPFALLPADGIGLVEDLFGVALLLIALLCLAAPILRFRRARGVERQQLKWFLSGGSLLVVALLLEPLASPFPTLRVISDFAFPVALAAMPIAIALAVLRHGLYEIDRIISRTIGYALVSLALLAVYAVGVLVLTQLTARITGGEAVAVAASTLAAAALFRPLRRRIQAAVDRRFYRARYDAQQTLDAFGARLRAEVDLDRLTDALVTVAAGSVQPTAAWIWIRERSS